jgi:diguanylate cyclase (GGDEF)-like protein
MFDMKKFVLFLVTLALALLGITKADMLSPQLADFLSRPIELELSQLIGGAVASLAVVLYVGYASWSWANTRFEATLQKLLLKEQEIDVLHAQLRDRDRLRLLDIVTGIPNQLKWEKDVKDLSGPERVQPRYQMIIIDLDNFREINRVYGYEKGDRVIKHFATSIFNTMRRDEHIYKNLVRGENAAPIKIEDHWQRIYRKYTGGDEFLLTVNGDQLEALGFLVRLERDLLPQINQRISEFILEREVKLSFHAGMCEWIQGDEPQHVLLRLEATLKKAFESSTSRLYFYPEMSAQEYEKKVLASTGKPPRWNPYRDAERLFAKSAP